jgi:hypothetical protein
MKTFTFPNPGKVPDLSSTLKPWTLIGAVSMISARRFSLLKMET